MSASPSVSPVTDLPLAGNADDDPGMSQIRASGRGSTLKRAIFGDSDDDLTDLSDTDAESDNGDADSNADSDADADVGDEESDEDIKPAKKKAKTGPSGSKAKALSKGKAKVGAGKTKGKGKAKSKGKGKKKGVKKTKTPKVDPVDGRLIARRPEWGDIPDWEGKEGSYLMGMPADIMDKCFGLGQDLALRDYLALAGTCRYFRQFLDDDFFHHLWHKRGKTSNSSLAYKIGARDKTKQIRDPDSKDEDPKWLSVPNVPDHPPGEKPFSRTVKDIYSAPGDCCIANTDKKGRFLHYVPRLSRKKWTREQYTVYKEEKREFYLSAVKRTKKKIKAVDAEMAGLRRTKQRWETVHINGVNRHVLATVEGRRDGEKAVKKDDKGLPLAADSDGEGDSDNDGTLIARRGQLGNGETGEPRRVRKMRLNQQLKADIAKAVKAEEWGVPDTDEETDEVVQEFKSLRVRKYDEYGHAVVHDCWPSQWRAIIAEEVRESKINLTTAMRDYHVQRSELITLKHWLVSNPMSTTTPQQTFSRAAVEALAFRSHGGAEGHAAHLANQERKAKDREQAKKDKIAEAKKNGTYVKPKWRPPRFPTYVFAERKAVGCQYILGHRHCQCEACMDFGNEECSGCSTCEDENFCHSCGNVHWG